MIRESYWFVPRPASTRHGHPFLVFDTQNRLHFALTRFAKLSFDARAASTTRVYLYHLLPFFSYLDTAPHLCAAQITWQSPADQVRIAVHDYLTQRLACKVQEHPDGFKIVHLTEDSRDTLRLFLTALKGFYRVMRQQGLYAHNNPLVDSASSAIREIAAILELSPKGTPQMPPESGLTLPSQKRLTDSYYKLLFEEWIPQAIDDVSLAKQVLEAGTAYGWSLREVCVTRLLFETGARLSEIVGLRLDDWVCLDALRQAWTFNKGSHGRRVKKLRFTPETSKLLRRYVDTERNMLGEARQTVDDYLALYRADPQARALRAPLFLTTQGTHLSTTTFRDYYWRPACRAAGLNVDPHQARHWYVTQQVRQIYATSEAEADIKRGLRALIHYMHWKQGWKTIDAYEHFFDEERHAEQQNRLHERMYAPVQPLLEPDTMPPPHRPPAPSPNERGHDMLDVSDDEDEDFGFLRAIGG
jgi:site-specific recombinase XerC